MMKQASSGLESLLVDRELKVKPPRLNVAPPTIRFKPESIGPKVRMLPKRG